MSINTSHSNNIEYKIELNGTPIKSGTLNAEESYLEFDNFAIKGVNSVVITLKSDYAFILNKLNASVSGSITYSNTHRRVSVLNESDCSYLLTLNENEFEIYKYTSENGLKSLFRRSGILDCHLSAHINEELYILYIDLFVTVAQESF